MSSPTLTLPQGYLARPVEMAEAAAVTALVGAEELHDLGEVLIEEADYVSDWQRPSFDLETQTLGVWRGEELAGWMQGCARQQGMSVVGAPVPQGKAADQLLEKLGYRVRWTSWVLELLDGATIAERELPDGYAVREAAPADYEAVWTVTEDAFLEWSDRERQSFEDWQAAVPGRPGFVPWNIRVVTDPAGAVVATSNIHLNGEERLGAYIDRLATHRDHRHRGLAQALLVDSFTVGHAHGAVRSELSTDSRTGALALYEKVGMSVTSTWVNRAIDL